MSGRKKKKYIIHITRIYYISTRNKYLVYQDSVAGSVIQASGMVLFEDALKAGTLVEDLWSNANVRTTPVVDLAPQVGSHPDLGVWCGVQEDLLQSNIGGPNGHAEFQATPEGQGH